MEVNIAVNESKKYLLGTNEFMALKNAYTVLKKNPKAISLVEQFRKKEESVYSSYQGSVSQNQLQYLMDELNNDYEKLMKIPEIQKYFNASESFNVVFNNYVNTLNESIFKDINSV